MPTSFKTKLRLEFQDDCTFKLTEPFEYYIDNPPTEDGGAGKEDETFVVPAGFVTDFASIPRVFWSIFPPAGKYGKAAVLHDYLYKTQIVSKAKADLMFLGAMKVLGVPARVRIPIYLGVLSGGWWMWFKHRRALKCL